MRQESTKTRRKKSISDIMHRWDMNALRWRRERLTELGEVPPAVTELKAIVPGTAGLTVSRKRCHRRAA